MSEPTGPVIRIMIVDDHAVVRDGLKAVISLMDDLAVVAEAGNGAEAMLKAQACAPDVILMDIGMKGENGIEVTQRLLDEDPARAVLMLTMHDGVEHAQRALKAGARGYVLKDAPSGEILEAIRAVAEGGSFLSPALAVRMYRPPTARVQLSEREHEILRQWFIVHVVWSLDALNEVFA